MSTRNDRALSVNGGVPLELATRTRAGLVKNVAVYCSPPGVVALLQLASGAPAPAASWQVRPLAVAIERRSSPEGPLAAPGTGVGMPSASAPGAATASANPAISAAQARNRSARSRARSTVT